MTNRAVVSLLWPGSQESLCRYVQETGVTVLMRQDDCGEGIRNAIANAGGKVVILDDLLSSDDVSRIRLIAHSKAEQLRKALHGGAMERVAGKWHVDSKVTTDWLEGAKLRTMLSFLSLAEQLEKARSQYLVELTILNEEWTETGRSVLLWSKQNSIPVLHVTHGIGLSRYYTVHSTLEADKYAVFGERGAESLLDEGVSRDRIVEVGNPGWDVYSSLVSRKSEIRVKLCAKHDLESSKPIIVFGTTWNAFLTAFDQRSYIRELDHVIQAFSYLRAHGFPDAQLVVKDRVTHGNEAQQFHEAINRAGLTSESVISTAENPKEWVVAADVLISVDSNMAVECVLAGTPAVNLIDKTGLLLGPSFAADGAIIEAMPENLSEVLGNLLNSQETISAMRNAMKRKASFYNIGVDGQALSRLTNLMKTMAQSSTNVVPSQYVWQTLLNVDDADATQYHNWPRSELVDKAPRVPRRVLDIGCAAGKTGEYIKHKFPQAQVFGVEVNRTAAALAAERLDKVFVGKFEDFDFLAHGIELGSLDTVIVADVLEHIYDPWGVLVKLKPYLTPDAQVLASIPNTRNLALMNDLAEGRWRYEAWGLLDVTHIRFFTLKEIRRFFHETGYHVVGVNYNIDGRLTGLYKEHQDKPLINIEFDKLTLKNVTQEELTELCSLQIYVVAEPGAIDNKAFEALEQKRIRDDEPRPIYDLWLEPRMLTKVQGSLYEQRMVTWASRPRFHLVIVYTEGHERLAASIQSLATQYYHDIRLTIVSPELPPDGWSDSNSLVWRCASVDELLEVANRVLSEDLADWVGLIDAGDTVAPHSFLFLAEAVNAHPDWRFIYTDEDVLLPDGKHDSPHFKPDFNLDLIRSIPYIGGISLIARTLFESLGGFSQQLKGAEDYDLALRAYEQVGYKAIGHLPDVLYHRLKDGGRWKIRAPELVEMGKHVLEAHLLRSRIHTSVQHGMFPGSYRVRYQHNSKPRVSILIAVRDQLNAMQRCIESLLSTTLYPDYEILIIDNASTFPETNTYLEGLEALGDQRLRVYSYPYAANLPRLHNLLAQEATGEYLLFMHFDAAVLQNDWLDSLMSHALRPDVGIVAPRLLLSDGKVAQSGLVLGLNQTVDTVFNGESIDEPGYFGRAQLEQDFSALGGGCLLVRKSLFEDVGGFDEINYTTNFVEADFSKRVVDQSLLAVWTPFVNVLCDGAAPSHTWCDAPLEENAVQVVRYEEEEHFYQRHLPNLAIDPAYNPNLSLWQGKYFTIEPHAVLNWDPLPWRPLPRVLSQPADLQGCGEYRILAPMRALVAAGRVQGTSEVQQFSLPEISRLDLDAIIYQRQVDPKQIAAITRLKKFNRALRVYELDDLVTHLPVRSIHNAHMPKDIAKGVRQAVGLCDRFIVSTEVLKEAYHNYHPDIRVVPNSLERARWGGFKPLRRQAVRPRVGWAGGIGHTGDLEMIADVVRTLADKVDWVFMCICPDVMRPYIKEFHPGVPLDQYPAKLASLNLDLAIAPLEQNPFNDAKSHLRLLEYGILGYPVVCSDVYPYQGDIPVTRVRNKHSDWVDAILEQVADLDKSARQGDQLRDYVESRWMLEDNLEMWLQAWLP